MTVEGVSQEQHTRDSFGRYRHPFKDERREVQTIYYPESKTISKRLHLIEGRDKYAEKTQVVTYDWIDYYMMFLHYLMPYGVTY